MRLTGEEIDTAALQLWVETFKAQCALPRGDNEPSRHVFYAECVADGAEKTFRERCAKENK